MSRLVNKVALVFGAATGIGAAVAERFAVEGARVIACGLPLPALSADVHALGGPALLCDVTVEEQVRAVVAEVMARHGRIDVLVNAAGVVGTDGAANIKDADWHRMHDVNLGGTMRTMRAVLPHMLARRAGSVVNIASVAAFNAGAESASYAASKAGVIALTRSAAHAYGASGIRANALCPGWVDTPMSRREMVDLGRELGVSAEAAHERTVERIALGRMASAAEMAAVCLFLASDEASFVTGVALVADGGARTPAAARGN